MKKGKRDDRLFCVRQMEEENCQILSENRKKVNVLKVWMPGLPLIHQTLYFAHRGGVWNINNTDVFLWLWVNQTLKVFPLVMDIPWLLALLFHLRLMKIPHMIIPMITTTSTTGMRMMMVLKPSCPSPPPMVEIRLIKMRFVSRGEDISLWICHLYSKCVLLYFLFLFSC